MKYILRILIILIIATTTSSCFDNLYNLHVDGVIAPEVKDDKCIWSYSEDSNFYYEYGVMDLAYTKLAGASAGKYSYRMFLGVKNLLNSEIKTTSETNININAVKIKNIVVKTYTDQNVLVDTEIINNNSVIYPNTGLPLDISIFTDSRKWEGTPANPGRNFLYSSFYDNVGGNGLITKYVIVDIVINAETFGGEYASSNHFKYKIDLCVDCLLCSENYLKDPVDYCITPTSLNDACIQNYGMSNPKAIGSLCVGYFQDKGMTCLTTEAGN